MSLQNKTRVGVHQSDHASSYSIIDVCKLSGPIAINFYRKHHFDVPKAALGLRQNSIRTLLSMATVSSNRVKLGKTVYPSFLGCFDPILFILAGNEDIHKSLDELEFWQDPIIN